MPRDIVKYGYNEHGTFHEFGNVSHVKDRVRAYELIDRLDSFFGFEVYERHIDVNEYGEASVTVRFSADHWVEYEERTEQLERMLKWLVLKLSVEELKYLGVLPKVLTRDPSTYSVEELMAGLREQFDEFRRADDRLRASIRGDGRGSR